MKLLTPTTAYQAASNPRKFHLLRRGSAGMTICSIVMFEMDRTEAAIADLDPDQLCQRCWRFETGE